MEVSEEGSQEEEEVEEEEEEEEEPRPAVALGPSAHMPPPRPSSSVQLATAEQDQEQAATAEQDQEQAATAEQQEQQAAREAGLRLYRAAEEGMRQAAENSACPDRQRLFAAVETAMADEHGLSWRERGPRGEDQPKVWRNQKWRPTSGRYANRGGTRQAEFAALFAAKGKKKGQKGEGKGKGSEGKNKAKGSEGKNKSKEGKGSEGKNKAKGSEGKNKSKEGKGSEGKNKAKDKGKDNSKGGKGLDAENKGKGKVPDHKGQDKTILSPKPKTRPAPYPSTDPGIIDMLSQFDLFSVIVFTLKCPELLPKQKYTAMAQLLSFYFFIELPSECKDLVCMAWRIPKSDTQLFHQAGHWQKMFW
jgi:hypothetical protein